MSESTITVPAEFAERFKEETREVLALSANNLREAMESLQRSDTPPEAVPGLRETEAEYRKRLPEAEALLAAVESKDGEIEVSAERWALDRALEGCLHEAVEEAFDAAGWRSRSKACAKIRASIAEMEFWLSAGEAVMV